MDLSDVRKNIDRVDAEIRKLFVERMTLADQVACIKAETEDKIYPEYSTKKYVKVSQIEKFCNRYGYHYEK